MLLMDDEFRTNLLDAADVTEFLAHIDEAERKKFPEEYGEEKQEQDQDQPEEGYRVLAVTPVISSFCTLSGTDRLQHIFCYFYKVIVFINIGI